MFLGLEKCKLPKLLRTNTRYLVLSFVLRLSCVSGPIIIERDLLGAFRIYCATNPFHLKFITPPYACKTHDDDTYATRLPVIFSRVQGAL